MNNEKASKPSTQKSFSKPKSKPKINNAQLQGSKQSLQFLSNSNSNKSLSTTYRKGTVEKSKSKSKNKTTKNSPDKIYINFINLNLQKVNSTQNKKKDVSLNQSFQVKNKFTSSKIKDNGNISLENMFKAKIKKIKTKQKSPNNSNQLTYSNLFLNKQISNKNILDITIKKNKIVSKYYKKNNFSLNDSSNFISPRIANNTSINKEKEFCKMYLKKNPSSQMIYTNKCKKKKTPSSNKNPIKKKAKSTSKSKEKKYNITNTSTNYIKHNNSKSSSILYPIENSISKISLSNLHLKSKPKKQIKTSCHTTKNSKEKISNSKKDKKTSIYNKLIKSLEVKTFMQKYTKKTSLKKNSKQNSNINNSHIRRLSNISNLKAFINGNLNVIKYSKNNIHCISSVIKNNNSSTKNTSLSNKSMKKKEEETNKERKNEKNSLTTVQSKNNSKSSNRLDERSLCLLTNADKNNERKYPATACHSPKRINEDINTNIFENCKNEILIVSNNANKNFTKINLDRANLDKFFNKKQNEEFVNNHIETENISIDKILETPRHQEIQNETITSINSTMKENTYYRKEFDRISNYIKQCNFLLILNRSFFNRRLPSLKIRILFIRSHDRQRRIRKSQFSSSYLIRKTRRYKII